jgi:hypothetical protein
MRFSDLASLVSGLACFELPLLSQAFPDRRPAIRLQLARWIKQGKVIHLRRGIYTLPDHARKISLDPAVLAQHLCRPSYLSGLWALGFHDMIPERGRRETGDQGGGGYPSFGRRATTAGRKHDHSGESARIAELRKMSSVPVVFFSSAARAAANCQNCEYQVVATVTRSSPSQLFGSRGSKRPELHDHHLKIIGLDEVADAQRGHKEDAEICLSRLATRKGCISQHPLNFSCCGRYCITILSRDPDRSQFPIGYLRARNGILHARLARSAKI